MNIQELATISINKIPVKIVILNNGYLGMVRQWQELFYERRYSSTSLMGPSGQSPSRGRGRKKSGRGYVPDFIALARSYGIDAFRAETPEEMIPVLRKGLRCAGPALMEFAVSPEENVFPMVPAGKSIDHVLEEA